MLLVSGCGALSFFEKSPVFQVVANIEAANNINPNIDGLASPLEVRIYQLQDSEAFNQANFIDLYNDDQSVLKAGLLSKRNLASVLPNEKRQIFLPLVNGTKFIAVVTAFSNYREAKNKAILSVQPGLPIIIDIRIDGINVSIIGQEE